MWLECVQTSEESAESLWLRIQRQMKTADIMVGVMDGEIKKRKKTNLVTTGGSLMITDTGTDGGLQPHCSFLEGQHGGVIQISGVY